jgi:hypothetical protein
VYAQRLDLFDSVFVKNDRDVRRSITAIRRAVAGQDDAFGALQRLAAAR